MCLGGRLAEILCFPLKQLNIMACTVQQENKGTGYRELWVKRVHGFSSQYDAHGWSANSVIGSPKVYPDYGDKQGSWAQASCSSSEYIELLYGEKLYIEEIDIYETLNAGAVTRVAAMSPQGNWVTLWDTQTASSINHSRVFTPNIDIPSFMTNMLRLELDCTVSGSWCEIDAVQIKGRKYHIESPPPLSTLSEELGEMVNNSILSDVQFEVEGKIIYGHRVLLAARSDYFKAMFTDGLKESQPLDKPIVMPDVSHAAFLGMMQFIYTNKLDPVNPENLVDLIRVGDRFSMPGLKKLSQFSLNGSLSDKNVVLVYREATEKMPVLDDVRTNCIHFMSENLNKVTKSAAFSELPQEVMLEIIQKTTENLQI